MNIKTQIKLKAARDNIVKFLRKPLVFLLTPLIDYEDKKQNEEYEKRVDYIKNMSEEELMTRFAKYMIKEMIRRNENKKSFYICNKKSRYDELDDGFIVYELKHISHKCKDKYLKSYYYTSNKFNIWDDGIMEVENRLNKLLKEEVEKLGCKVEFIDERDTMSEFWVKDSEYQNTMIIYLPK